ncbi:MAG: hypothetical protein JWS10_2167 [Cypionkella sp.]|uniref:hypothetical protein n=1 Tax=Cypionkella sp. TaxID=2811411 RepID=UPI00262D522A|nr:hypothetical protein [Cypionkella sp.]MDB5659552.1 hypothetical protein [Cypionkella sp.]
MTTLRQTIAVQLDAELAKSGLLDAVKTPDDKKVFDRHRRTLIDNAMMTVKLGPMPRT